MTTTYFAMHRLLKIACPTHMIIASFFLSCMDHCHGFDLHGLLPDSLAVHGCLSFLPAINYIYSLY